MVGIQEWRGYRSRKIAWKCWVLIAGDNLLQAVISVYQMASTTVLLLRALGWGRTMQNICCNAWNGVKQKRPDEGCSFGTEQRTATKIVWFVYNIGCHFVFLGSLCLYVALEILAMFKFSRWDGFLGISFLWIIFCVLTQLFSFLRWIKSE